MSERSMINLRPPMNRSYHEPLGKTPISQKSLSHHEKYPMYEKHYGRYIRNNQIEEEVKENVTFFLNYVREISQFLSKKVSKNEFCSRNFPIFVLKNEYK